MLGGLQPQRAPSTTPSPPHAARTVLLGFPTDVNSSFQRGPAKGPALIRKALISPHSNPYSERMTNVLSPQASG